MPVQPQFEQISAFVFCAMMALTVQASPSFGQSSIKTGDTTPVPCIEESQKAARPVCLIGLRECADVKSSVKSHIEDHLKKKVDFYYQGLDINFSKTVDVNDPQGYHFEPVCNPVEGETKTNRNGQSCGKFIKIGSNGANFGKDERGQRETNLRRGTWVAALKCYEQQVLQEIEKDGKVQRSQTTQAFGEDVSKLFKNANNANSTFIAALGANAKNFCQQASMKAFKKNVPDLCQSEFNKKATTDMIKNRQNACYLSAGREATEAAFARLAIMEVYARAVKAYNDVFIGPNNLFEQHLNQHVTSTCKSKAKKSYVRKLASTGSTSQAKKAGLKTANSCYQKRVIKLFEDMMKVEFPKNGQCRQVRNMDRQDSKPVPANVGILGLFILLLLTACSGGGGGNQVAKEYCVDSQGNPMTNKNLALGKGKFNGKQPCCDKKTKLATILLSGFPPEHCPQPLDRAIIDILPRAVSDVQRAGTMFEQADRLAGGKTEAQVGGQQSAARAAQPKRNTPGHNGNGNGEIPGTELLSQLEDLAEGGEEGRAGGASVSGGDAGAELGATGSVQDTKAKRTGWDPLDLGARKGKSKAIARGGRKGGSQSRSKFESQQKKFLSAAGGAGKGQAFGTTAVQSEKNLAEGKDPIDYFSMLNEYADLFKVVERKYRQQAIHWSISEAKQTLAHYEDKGRSPASTKKKKPNNTTRLAE